ncbi:hypothetical protein, unlikely [Trypanosoma brucei gambiense DAL972]|uniref:Uncharacterized protein n=1 Tax=Trypanosoma brucei gambiense (strain MHOM/CI/86/DAL972) TaxID=679716 RepID=D0A665_TRYB9|nr:hypothetical protein, unlikely [Trypanosoma brucei gambiense DAL972]CBH17166.1 hypothetical protein, unlikely [Trypanosoma brucei gambiense DAL972]|eukprot:XP_011779430.1 hypothetical protein, unlikely [Trypanosoma brucei gambiense DAL972]
MVVCFTFVDVNVYVCVSGRLFVKVLMFVFLNYFETWSSIFAAASPICACGRALQTLLLVNECLEGTTCERLFLLFAPSSSLLLCESLESCSTFRKWHTLLVRVEPFVHFSFQFLFVRC